MASNVEFNDFSVQVMGAIDDRIDGVLAEVAGEIISQTKRNSRVGSAGAKTKNSFQYKVDTSTHTAYMGSPDENALWEEMGTGEHALQGNGRKGAWYVPVEKVTGYKKPTYNGKVVIIHGKDGQKFYKTNGKKPSRAFWKAFESLKNAIIKRIQDSLKGL